MPRDMTPYPLEDALAAIDGAQGGVVIVTMRVGQWDDMLAAFYAADCILLELDDRRVAVRAYRRTEQAEPLRAGAGDATP